MEEMAEAQKLMNEKELPPGVRRLYNADTGEITECVVPEKPIKKESKNGKMHNSRHTT